MVLDLRYAAAILAICLAATQARAESLSERRAAKENVETIEVDVAYGKLDKENCAKTFGISLHQAILDAAKKLDAVTARQLRCPSPAWSAIIFCPALRKVKATAIGPRSHESARRILGLKTHFVLWKATEMLAMSWGGGTIDCGSFSVSFTQALHSSSTIINGQSVYLGNNGLVIKPKDASERLPHGRHRSGSRLPLPAG